MRLNDRITVQQRVSGIDSAGQPSVNWQDVGAFWADVRHLSGIETLRAGAQTSLLRASIRMWYRPDVDATMRVSHNGVLYDIKAVPRNAFDRRFMDLVCEAAT